jgi:predicted metal-dependent peptidase
MSTATVAAISEDARLRVMAARIVAQSRWPYLSTLLFNLKIVESHELPTLAVDEGWRMYYSPEFVMDQTPEALATMVLHEALHCVNQHGPRFRALTQPSERHVAWNSAGDVGINHVLDEAHMPWGDFEPLRFSHLSKFDVKPEMATEKIYFTIVDYINEHPDEFQSQSDCGSVVGGKARDYEIARSDSGNPAIKSDQQDVIRDQVAQEILNHARNKGIGSLPGFLLRWAEDLLEPKIDWRKAFAGAFRSSLATVLGRRDYVYTRPSRRQSAMRTGSHEIILPSMRKPAPPAIAIVVDTSGSVSIDEIKMFLTEVDGIVKANGISQGVTVIPCDAEVGEIQKLRSRGAITTLRLHGGGGTDMGVGIAAAGLLRPTPKIIVVFTDGYTGWPDGLPKGVETMIVCLTASECLETTPSWAKKILIERDE